MIHELKIKPEYFAAVVSGDKTFEIRNNADRNFQVGDTLLLWEWDGGFTSQTVERTVSYITDFEQKPGYVVLGLVNHREHEMELAAQLSDATRQCGVMADLLREVTQVIPAIGVAIDDLPVVDAFLERIEVVRDQCSCGEPISIELNCPLRTSRTDKKRPFYPDQGLPEGLDPQRYSEHGSSVFRCRKCGEPVSETVQSAKYEKAE